MATPAPAASVSSSQPGLENSSIMLIRSQSRSQHLLHVDAPAVLHKILHQHQHLSHPLTMVPALRP